MKVKVLSGDVKDLIGEEIIQGVDPFDPKAGYASAIVDNVFSAGVVDGEQLYEIALDTSSVNNTFKIASKTELTADFDNNLGAGDRINVFSTEGFAPTGRFMIRGEEFEYSDKSVTQFLVSSREKATLSTLLENLFIVFPQLHLETSNF